MQGPLTCPPPSVPALISRFLLLVLPTTSKPLPTQATAPTAVPLASLPSAPWMVSPLDQLRAMQGG